MLRFLMAFWPLLALVCAVFTSIGHLAWGRGDTVPGSRYTSARGAALADSVMPLVDDGASALFYNPAAIGKIRKATAEPFNLTLQGNSEYLGMVDRNFYKVYSLSSYQPTLSGKPFQYPGVGASIFPNFSTRGFAIGALMQREYAAKALPGPNLVYKSNLQFIPTAGFGLRLASGVVRLGYSFQWVNEAKGEVTAAKASSTLGYNQGLPTGGGFSHNAGIAINFPYAYLPSFNLVARNIMGVKYTGTSLLTFSSNPSGTPADEPMTFDAGLSLSPKGPSGSVFNVSFVYRDMTNRSSMPILSRATLGLELNIRESLFFRGGLGSGYPSAGIGIGTQKGSFSFAWFSEETGNSYRSERDVKYMVQFLVRAF